MKNENAIFQNKCSFNGFERIQIADIFTILGHYFTLTLHLLGDNKQTTENEVSNTKAFHFQKIADNYSLINCLLKFAFT